MGGSAVPDLDATDRRIIDLLRSDGRISVNALAEAVGVSRANAYRRMDRLRDNGVIRGFSARVDAALVGRPITAVLLLAVQQKHWRSVRSMLTNLAEDGVEYLAATAGPFDFVALIRTPDMTTLRDVILGKVHATPGVISTQTICVLDEVLGP
jgi:DNA-binding Lrp family transcriptional regulator